MRAEQPNTNGLLAGRGGDGEQKVIISHPDNLKGIETVEHDGTIALHAEQLVCDRHIPKTAMFPTGKYLWHAGGYFPPSERFVEYEDSDLPWLEKLGFVRKEMREGNLIFRMQEQLMRQVDREIFAGEPLATKDERGCTIFLGFALDSVPIARDRRMLFASCL